MPFIHDTALDALLNDLVANGESLHICSTEPTDYTEATATYSLGEKTSPTINAQSDRGGGGREVIIDAITDGAVDGDGTADFWAIVKDSATARLLAAGDLAAPQGVSNGNTFTLTQFTVGVPDAV
jgi:hypothetical protein